MGARRLSLDVSLANPGTPAPVFPGFEVDISDRVPDGEKPDAVWHRDRARGMLRDHPEIRELFTRSKTTAFWCVLFAASQVALAVAVGGQPLWIVLLCAYVIGSWINICLFNLAHECNHCLVFGNKKWDRWLFTLWLAQAGEFGFVLLSFTVANDVIPR